MSRFGFDSPPSNHFPTYGFPTFSGGGSFSPSAAARPSLTHLPRLDVEKSIVKFKTRICVFWLQKIGCHYGERCLYAHGPSELRQDSDAPISPEEAHFPPSHESSVMPFKSRLCPHWIESASCPQGSTCCFAHGIEEMSDFSRLQEQQKIFAQQQPHVHKDALQRLFFEQQQKMLASFNSPERSSEVAVASVPVSFDPTLQSPVNSGSSTRIAAAHTNATIEPDSAFPSIAPSTRTPLKLSGEAAPFRPEFDFSAGSAQPAAASTTTPQTIYSSPTGLCSPSSGIDGEVSVVSSPVADESSLVNVGSAPGTDAYAQVGSSVEPLEKGMHSAESLAHSAVAWSPSSHAVIDLEYVSPQVAADIKRMSPSDLALFLNRQYNATQQDYIPRVQPSVLKHPTSHALAQYEVAQQRLQQEKQLQREAAILRQEQQVRLEQQQLRQYQVHMQSPHDQNLQHTQRHVDYSAPPSGQISRSAIPSTAPPPLPYITSSLNAPPPPSSPYHIVNPGGMVASVGASGPPRYAAGDPPARHWSGAQAPLWVHAQQQFGGGNSNRRSFTPQQQQQPPRGPNVYSSDAAGWPPAMHGVGLHAPAPSAYMSAAMHGGPSRGPSAVLYTAPRHQRQQVPLQPQQMYQPRDYVADQQHSPAMSLPSRQPQQKPLDQPRGGLFPGASSFPPAYHGHSHDILLQSNSGVGQDVRGAAKAAPQFQQQLPSVGPLDLSFLPGLAALRDGTAFGPQAASVLTPSHNAPIPLIFEDTLIIPGAQAERVGSVL